MRPIRHVFCGEAATETSGVGADSIQLRSYGPETNVHVSIDQINRPLWQNISDRSIDLIEIASYIYTADQMTKRGGPGVDDMGERWRRHFRFVIPVRQLDVWRTPAVAQALVDVLSFLSEDRYEFEFRPFQRPPSHDSIVSLWDELPGVDVDEVMLFSGGLDSLAGAVRSVVDLGQRVILVTHMPTGKLLQRHEELRHALSASAKGGKPIFIPVSINKDKDLSLESTQRSRSFLFASLAFAISQACGKSAFNFFENGVVSLNLPISRQVVGSKATRTTHPKVLAGMRRLFSAIQGARVDVENPFLWKTKTDIVSDILRSDCGRMIGSSMSCTHTRELSNAVTHCGRCSQCIDRRFATLAAGAEDFDPTDIYAVDLFHDDREKTEDRTLFASYAETARQVADYTPQQFFQRYGEIARVVRSLNAPPDQVAHSVFELYRRHGRQVKGVIDAAVAKGAPLLANRTAKPTSGLRLIVDQEALPVTRVIQQMTLPMDTTPAYEFRLKADFWQVRFDGGERSHYLASIGMVHLRELIRNAHTRIGAEQFLIMAHGMKASLPLGASDAVIDAGAHRAYSIAIEDLRHEISEGEKNGDGARVEKAKRSLTALASDVQRLGWQSRKEKLSRDRDRVRNSVSNAINRAIDKMKRPDPKCWKHFRDSISLGHSIIYAPKTPVAWTIL